ncbi:MAG TPA: RRXRR domain-containing protein [Clostridiaceae bacterium]
MSCGSRLCGYREKIAGLRCRYYKGQLLIFGSSGYKQDIILGIDSGYNNIGFSAVTEKKELIVGELKLLQGMKERLLEKSSYRKMRHSRLRYRKVRWNNRTKSKPKGWLAPSLQHK